MKTEKKAVQRHYAVCPHDCPSTCALEVEKQDENTIGRIHGSKKNSYTDGVICAKVARYAERVHNPDRLRTPMKRVGAKGVGIEAFEPISWDEALDTIAERFQEIAHEDGPEAIWPYFYAGTMGWCQQYAAHRLRYAMGYSRQKETICVGISNAGWQAGIGSKKGVDTQEVAESDLIVIWGGNPVHTQINVMTHVAKATRNGAKLVVVDPYRTPTAAKADLHLKLRPGTDGALACAVMHQLLEDGNVDLPYLEKYTDFDDGVRAHLKSRTPEWAAAITGLKAEEIVEFARMYGASAKSFIRVGYGMSRSRNGASNMHAVTCLPAMTGAWQYLGGGALYGHGDIYTRVDRKFFHGAQLADTAARELDMSRIGPVLTGDLKDLGDGPQVKALFIQSTNPMVVAPDLNKVHRGFAREDLFIVVHEQVMTETAAMADILLPATTFLEHDDLYSASGHTSLQVSKRIINPYAECRSNHEVVQGLAERLGIKDELFEMDALQMVDRALAQAGLPSADEVHAAQGIDLADGFEEAHFLNGFGHADRRFHFYADWQALGDREKRLPVLPDHAELIDQADADHPFRLVTAPARTFLNSSFTETGSSLKKEKRPTLFIHPEDCSEYRIAEGDVVTLGNSLGQVRVWAKPFEGVSRGVLIVEGIWPNGAFLDGVGINALISAEPALPNGGAVFHDTKVWIKKEEK